MLLMLSATHLTHSTLQKKVSFFFDWLYYIYIDWPSFRIGMLFHFQWNSLLPHSLKQSRNRSILKLSLRKAFSDFFYCKFVLRQQCFADNLHTPADFGMFMHITCWAPVGFIKISPHYPGLRAFPLAMRSCTLKLMATTPINNLDCRAQLEKTVNRWRPVVCHPFYNISW